MPKDKDTAATRAVKKGSGLLGRAGRALGGRAAQLERAIEGGVDTRTKGPVKGAKHRSE